MALTIQALRLACLVCWLGAVGAAALASLAGAGEGRSPGACPLRYGSLMTGHWLTVDLARQIERGLSYDRGTEAAKLSVELERLQESIAAAGRELEGARSLHKAWFATNSAEGLVQLDGLLERIAAVEFDNDTAATALLQKLGEHNSLE